MVGDPLEVRNFDRAVELTQSLDMDLVGVLGSLGPLDFGVTLEENRCAFMLRCGAIATPASPHYDRPQHPECAGHMPEPGHLQIYLPRNLAAWGEFVRAVAERYDGDGVDDMAGLVHPIKVWQIGAEYPRVWCSDAENPAEEYIELARATLGFLREADPEAVLKMSGVASDAVRLLAFVDGFLGDAPITLRGQRVTRDNARALPQIVGMRATIEPMLRATDLFAIADIHLYGDYASIPGRLAWLRALSGEIPVWALEGGGPFGPAGEDYRDPGDPSTEANADVERDNAHYVTKYYLTGLHAGFDVLAWHLPSEYDTWDPAWGDLDLLRYDGTPRPSYHTYRHLTRLLDGHVTIESINTYAPAKAYRVEWPHDRTLLVVWSDDDSIRVDLATGPPDRVFRLPAGPNETEPTDLSGDLADVIVGRAPVFVAHGQPQLAPRFEK